MFVGSTAFKLDVPIPHVVFAEACGGQKGCPSSFSHRRMVSQQVCVTEQFGYQGLLFLQRFICSLN